MDIKIHDAIKKISLDMQGIIDLREIYHKEQDEKILLLQTDIDQLLEVSGQLKREGSHGNLIAAD